MKTFIAILGVTFIVFMINGCSKKKCQGDPIRLEYANFKLDFVDASGNYLFTKSGPLSREDVTVFNEAGKGLPFSWWNENFQRVPTVIDGYSLVIDSIISAAVPNDIRICRRLYLDFKTDRDTLDYCFTPFFDGCSPDALDMEVKFNGKLIPRPDYIERRTEGAFYERTITK